MATTETRSAQAKTRSWDTVTRWVMLGWVAVGFVYFVMHVDSINPALGYLWLAVQAVLTIAHIALGVRR